MQTVKVIANGGSQAVRLPKAYRFDAEEVYANKVGDIVMLIDKESDRAGTMACALDMFTEDFMADTEDLPPEEETLF